MRVVFRVFACSVLMVLSLYKPMCLAADDVEGGPPYNIILITPDQMAADFMHVYGSTYADTPNIDKLAEQGTLFLHSYAAGPWTTPSFTSIFTGLFPTVHGMTLPPYQGCGLYITTPIANGKIPSIPPEVNLSPHKPLLSELLKKQGMTTAMDNANCWSIFYQVGRGWDYSKFFPGYGLLTAAHPDRDDPFYLTASGTLAWAQDWLRIHHNERFFLWVHFMEPHDPFNAPSPYDRFKTRDDFPNLREDNSKDERTLNALAKLGNVHAIRRLDQLYAAKIMYVDHYIGELVKTIRDYGLEKDSIIVLLSDHGQLMYRHPEDFNTNDHRSIYDADLHVPLIIVGPQIPAGRRVDPIVSEYDILPTILDLENISPLPRADGKSLKPVLFGTATQVHKYVYGEETALEPQYSIRDARYKLIESLRNWPDPVF